MEAFEPSEEKEEEITMVDEDEEIYSDPFSANERDREREEVLVS